MEPGHRVQGGAGLERGTTQITRTSGSTASPDAGNLHSSANVLVGIAVSFLGLWTAGLLGIAPTGGIRRFIVAVIGAVALVFTLCALGMFKKG